MEIPSNDILRGRGFRPSLDRLLRFDHTTELRYEAEYGAERVAQLRNGVVFGFLLYVMHGISKVALFPGAVLLIFTVTAFVVLPFAVLYYRYMDAMQHRTRENLLFLGVSVATILPVYMVYTEDQRLGLYFNMDVVICVVFSNALLALRFQHAVFYTLSVFVFVALAILLKDDVDTGLKKALVFQFATVCTVCLYSNYLFERRRCMDYCMSSEAVLRADAAETSEKQFQLMSQTDALTGLPNRRFLDETLDEWAADDRSAVVMMVDIDHFKMFNDALGHPAGDECLRTIARTFAHSFSEPGQFCARFGGEEFILAVRDAGELRARRMAQALVRAIEDMRIPHPGRTDGMEIVTISVGVALKPVDVTTSRENFLSLADEALYQAKRRGRNRFVVSDGICESQSAVTV